MGNNRLSANTLYKIVYKSMCTYLIIVYRKYIIEHIYLYEENERFIHQTGMFSFANTCIPNNDDLKYNI